MRFFSFNLERPLRYFKGGEFTSDEPWQHAHHYHQGDYEIIFCVRGTLFVRVGESRYQVKAGSLLIVPPYHELIGYQLSKPGLDFYWVHFFPQGDVGYYEGVSQDFRDVYANTSHHVTLPMHFQVTNEEELAVSLHQLISMEKNQGDVQKRDFVISSLLIDLYENFNSQLTVSKGELQLKNICQWIAANMTSSLTVEEIAEQVHLNRDYLTRLFRKHLGMTTNQYLNKIKVEAACLILLRTDMPIKEIAPQAFFSSTRVFMRRFKALKGTTPSRYRRQFQGIVKNNAEVSPLIPLTAKMADILSGLAVKEGGRQRGS